MFVKLLQTSTDIFMVNSVEKRLSGILTITLIRALMYLSVCRLIIDMYVNTKYLNAIQYANEARHTENQLGL